MKKHKMLPNIISEHIHDICSFAKEEYVDYLIQRYPNLAVIIINIGSSSSTKTRRGRLFFTVATTMNSMEGEN